MLPMPVEELVRMVRVVPYQVWTPVGMVDHGYMDKKDIEEELRQFGIRAKAEMNKCGGRHAIYGLKIFDKNGYVKLVKMYVGAIFDEDEFYKRTRHIDGLVYAVHSRR